MCVNPTRGCFVTIFCTALNHYRHVPNCLSKFIYVWFRVMYIHLDCLYIFALAICPVRKSCDDFIVQYYIDKCVNIFQNSHHTTEQTRLYFIYFFVREKLQFCWKKISTTFHCVIYFVEKSGICTPDTLVISFHWTWYELFSSTSKHGSSNRFSILGKLADQFFTLVFFSTLNLINIHMYIITILTSIFIFRSVIIYNAFHQSSFVFRVRIVAIWI